MPGLGGEGADLARLWEGDWAGKSSSIVFSFITPLPLTWDWQSCFLIYNVVVSVSIIHCEQERNIAIELEQKMMEDFEWKLREVEGGYKTKIKSLEEGLESKVSEGKVVFIVFNTDLYRSITTRGRSRARKTRSWRRCASTRAETWRRSWRRSGTVRRLLLRLLLQGQLRHLAWLINSKRSEHRV